MMSYSIMFFNKVKGIYVAHKNLMFADGFQFLFNFGIVTVHEKQRRKPMRAYTYIVECADQTLYTGWTNNLEKRIEKHNLGQGAKYTRNRRPVKLVYWEEFAEKKEAMQREAAIKKLTRSAKLLLIKNFVQKKK